MAELRLSVPSPVAESDRLRGSVLGGRFELLELLDEGGMAFVYVALDRVSGEQVAVKVLRRRLAESSEIRERFFHEARAMMGMVSRHIVEIVDVGPADDDHAYFAMELLDGPRLDELCGEPLPFDLVFDYARQIVAALQVAHGKGVIHRDLKPDNIFVERVGGRDVVKLIDFGIAKHQTASTLTMPGAVFGTPHYMAPEQAAGRREIGPHTDLYAVGVMLYELVAGEMPFDGMDAMQVMLAQIGLPPPSLRERRPDCPAELEAVILRCLQKRPDERYTSATALRQALDQLAGDAPTAAECHTADDDISGLRLKPAHRQEGAPASDPAVTVADARPSDPAVTVAEARPSDPAVDFAELPPAALATGRPTPTEPEPWAHPAAPSPRSRQLSRRPWLLAVAVTLSVAVTLIVAHLLGVAFV